MRGNPFWPPPCPHCQTPPSPRTSTKIDFSLIHYNSITKLMNRTLSCNRNSNRLPFIHVGNTLSLKAFLDYKILCSSKMKMTNKNSELEIIIVFWRPNLMRAFAFGFYPIPRPLLPNPSLLPHCGRPLWMTPKYFQCSKARFRVLTF